MALYFAFDLDGLADHNHYLDTLMSTMTQSQVALAIEEFRYDLDPRPRRMFPH